MRLGFLTHKYNAILKLDEYYYITNKRESKKYETEGFVPLSDATLQFAKALKHNEDFKGFIELSRLYTSFEPYNKNKIIQQNFNDWSEYKGLPDFEIEYKNLRFDSLSSKEIQKNFNIHPYLVPQIPYIIKHGCLLLKYLRPTIEIMPFSTIKEDYNTEMSDEECAKLLGITEDTPQRIKDYEIDTLKRNKNRIEAYAKEYAKMLNIPNDTPKEERDRLIEDDFDLNPDPDPNKNKYMGLERLFLHNMSSIKSNVPDISLSDNIFIKISSSNVSKKAISDFLKSSEIKKQLKALEYNNFYISTRDYKILKKNKKITAREMADILDPNCKNDKMSEWTVRTAHKRARDKIKSLFGVKPHYKAEFYEDLKIIRRCSVT